MFAVLSFMTLRAQHHDNMKLVARTTAYATETAVSLGVGWEHDAIKVMNGILTNEHLCSITILLADSSRFAHVNGNCHGPLDKIASVMAKMTIFQDETVADIIHSETHEKLGTVVIKDDGSLFVSFLRRSLCVFVLGLVLAVLAARVPARWMERRFVGELLALSGMARAARMEGNFHRRLPSFEIVEFNSLGQDFNALFGEIQARNAKLTLRQSQLKTINNTLSRMAMRDTLTGLANRACFSEQLERVIAKARETNTKIGMLYIDNDHFRDINTTYGHAGGDALLVNVGHRLSGAVRESDLVARLGGDEFAVLLSPVTGIDDLRFVANKVLAAMGRSLRLGEQEDIKIGVSIGMAIFPDHADDGESLLRAADRAMYRAKSFGRGRACLYDVRDQESAAGRKSETPSAEPPNGSRLPCDDSDDSA